MPVSTELVERSGDLKGELVEFALGPRFDRTFRKAFARRFGERDEIEEPEFTNFLDWFVLQERPPGGRTVVEQFVTMHPELSAEERALLLGWRDVVEGIFAVKQRDGEALVVDNLVDELTYRVRSNMGPAAFRPMRSGSFVITRLVPIGDEWLLSGMSTILPAASRDEAYSVAIELATHHPELVYRNPEKLERAWELQREEHRLFIDFFGSDAVVLPGHELTERMRAYYHFRVHEARDDRGETGAEVFAQEYGVAAPALDVQFPPELTAAETVGLICDEIEGLNFLLNFGLVEETFAVPARASDRKHRQVVLDYLKDPSISPLPFRRLAARDPERASQVFQRVLKQPKFSWPRDGEALLRRYKASFFKQPVLPSMSILSETLVRVQVGAAKPSQSGTARDRWRHWWKGEAS